MPPVIDWPSEALNEGQVLEHGIQALALLIGLMGIFHLLFRQRETQFKRINLLASRMRFPCLALVFALPAFWLTYWIPSLKDWFWTVRSLVNGALSLAGIEFVLCFLLDSSDGSRIDSTLRRLIRVPFYVIAALIVLSVAVGLPLFESDFQIRAGAVLLLFGALHLSYVYVFKILPWQHALSLALRERLRQWIYAFLSGLVLYFAVVHLQLAEQSSSQLEYLRAALGFVFGSILSEAVLVCLFDYYFPEVKKVDVPQLFRDLARGIAFLGVLALTAVFFLHKDPGSLLVGSAVLSVAIGFALQETLGNFFAGLALRLARPYTLGDRMEVLAHTGSVQKIDWRSTALLNSQGDLVIIPNAKLAQEAMINHSSPTPVTGRLIDVGLAYRHAPNLCKAVLLEAIASVNEVLSEPVPEIYIMNFGDSSVTYRLRFFIMDFAERFRIDSLVREAVWYHTQRANLEIPFPIRNVYHLEPQHGPDLAREVKSLLDTVDFFSILAQEDLEELSRRAILQTYAKGEHICRQGEPGDSFYIIKGGLLGVSAVDSQGDVFLSVEMKPGQYFGEMALLTGEPRSASVLAKTDAEVLRLGKEDLRHLLRVSPEVEQMISKRLAERQLQTSQALVSAEEERMAKAIVSNTSDERVEQLTEQFLRKIRHFFSY